MRSLVDEVLTARRIRVVTMIDRLVHGGAEHMAQWLAAGFDPERIDSTLVVSRFSTPAPSQQEAVASLQARGVRVLCLERRHTYDLWAWRRLTAFLRTSRTDVLHAHKFGSNIWASLLGPAVGVPVVLAHEHSWAAGRSAPHRLLDRFLIAPRVDRFIAVSREDQRRMVVDEHIDQARTVVLPNGIPVNQPRADRDIRAELGIPGAAPVIGLVASLTPVKAVEVLIEATAGLLPHHADLCVLIVGDGPDRAALEALTTRLSLDGVVRMLGHRDDVVDLLGAMDIAVCCSDSEGSPLSVIEYMQQGLPVVATAVGGLPDLIEDGVHGLLVPPRSPRALACALNALLGDRERMRAMGERAHARQRREYDLRILAGRLEELYRDLLRDKTPACTTQPMARAHARALPATLREKGPASTIRPAMRADDQGSRTAPALPKHDVGSR